ncbi:MerR family transcriptional regulator [Amycolatopsis sp. GM8]|uniref:MerR family transcriptional regulator n=1 Tax=Amycolatopsis sp. GM8 TaxID=2896530 RepID=UPI001F3CEA41|nr:MerR family transcriptional regulator [Amycolatopsis sp. GM8]
MATTTGFTIQEVSRRSGLSEPTLRYYEQIGLIGPVPRDPGSGHRRYDAAAVDTISSLACLRSAGMRVDGLRRYLDVLTRGNDAAAEQRELFTEQADRLSAQLDLMRLRLDYLRLKAQLWDARERGDAETEQDVIPRLVGLIDRI